MQTFAKSLQIAQTEMTDQPVVLQGARHGPTVAGASEEMSDASIEPSELLKADRLRPSPWQGCQPEQQEESLGKKSNLCANLTIVYACKADSCAS